jgi:hypothetical protein
MPRVGSRLKASITFLHRWLGVLCCLPFILWFASGIVLMYRQFPSVGERDRQHHAAPLDISAVRLTPREAYSRLGEGSDPGAARLATIAGRPAYAFATARRVAIVYADNGEVQDTSQFEFDRRVAADWAGLSPQAAYAQKLTEGDQWTVSGEFKPLEPIRKFTWPDGEEVYVSTVTGDVEQYTTRGSRVGAYFGAIPHWLYFTPLRKHGHLWTRIVIWLSALSVFTAFAGIVIGLVVYSPRKSYRQAGIATGIPYLGMKRLHMILGLSFGVIACTWAFSGLLSMDPFPKLQGTLDQSGDNLEEALRGGNVSLSAFDRKSPNDALHSVESGFQPKELELASFAGQPVYIAKDASGDVRILSLDGKVAREFDFNRIVDAVRTVSQPARIAEAKRIEKYDAYYLDRHGRAPLPAISIRLDDANASSYYIDLKTARVVATYNSRSRWNRWLYHGLHSFDLPWLYAHRPAWDVILLTLLTAGLFLASTAIVLAARVLRARSSFRPRP